MNCISLSVAAALVGLAFTLPATAQETEGTRETSVKKDPAAAAEKVTAALKEAEGVPAKDIAVSSHAGTIVLTGEVNSEAENVRATSAAEAASDGARVNSAIEVRAPQDRPMPQQKAAKMIRDVEEALRSDQRTANLGVSVSSEKEGVVVLHGLIASAESRSLAQGVASRVAGVTRVESRMVIPGD